MRIIKITLLTAALLFGISQWTARLQAAGTVTQTLNQIRPSVYEVVFSWTADASDGSIPNTDANGKIEASLLGLYLEKVITIPGSPSPTANYDIVINDENGIDLMTGQLADRSATANQAAYPQTISQAVTGTITLAISGNSVNSATGTIKAYFSRSSAPGNLAQSATAPINITPGLGATPHGFISTASDNATNLKTSAGAVYSIVAINPTATKQYLRLYNKASQPDTSACSANGDCPIIQLAIPTTGDTNGTGYAIPIGPLGWAFDTGIGYTINGAACTVLTTCTDETAASAGVEIVIGYK